MPEGSKPGSLREASSLVEAPSAAFLATFGVRPTILAMRGLRRMPAMFPLCNNIFAFLLVAEYYTGLSPNKYTGLWKQFDFITAKLRSTVIEEPSYITKGQT